MVVNFATGTRERVARMLEETHRLMPDREHFVVDPAELPRAGALRLWWTLRRSFRRYRIGMAPVLFDGTAGHRALRLAAWLLAPGRILAYNASLERHHLQLRTWLASLLFWRGVPLDRIYQRPRWLAWTTRDRTTVPADAEWHPGQLPRPGFRRIAVLTPFVPWPLAHGGAVRLHALLQQISRRYDVYLLAFRESETAAGLEPLLEFCRGIGLVSKPRYREPRWSSLLPPEVREYESDPMRRLIAQVRAQHRFELLQVEYTQLARYGGDILVEHDVTHDLYGQLHRRTMTLESWWNWWRWRRFENAAVRRFARVITMSAKDRELLGVRHARVIPNGVDLERFHPTPESDGRRLLFIGAFRHFPNVSAFRFLMDDVLPHLGDVELDVVAGPDAELHWRLATGAEAIPRDPRVRLHGFVSDVRPLYHDANAVLVPTLVSAGTNIKVLEAMAAGRAIVSTPSGCGGIPVEHGRHVWIADGAAAFAEGIRKLCADPVLRRALAEGGRGLVETRFGWATLGQMQRDVIGELLPERITLRPGIIEDVPAVRRIQAEALPSSRWDAELYLGHEFYVAFYDQTLAGFIVARKTAPDEREILNIAVAPEFRGLGIGERLLNRLVHSGEAGEVFLEVRQSNLLAQRLYERVGFRNAGLRPNYYEDPPETAVIMRARVLQPSFQNSSASERRM